MKSNLFGISSGWLDTALTPMSVSIYSITSQIDSAVVSVAAIVVLPVVIGNSVLVSVVVPDSGVVPTVIRLVPSVAGGDDSLLITVVSTAPGVVPMEIPLVPSVAGGDDSLVFCVVSIAPGVVPMEIPVVPFVAGDDSFAFSVVSSSACVLPIDTVVVLSADGDDSLLISVVRTAPAVVSMVSALVCSPVAEVSEGCVVVPKHENITLTYNASLVMMRSQKCFFRKLPSVTTVVGAGAHAITDKVTSFGDALSSVLVNSMTIFETFPLGNRLVGRAFGDP